MPLDADISRYCYQTFDYHNDNWGNNYLLSRRFYDDNIKKVLLIDLVLKKNFSRLKNVYVCHTSDSTGLLYSLKATFGCKITVLTNHPLFERMHDYYDDTLSGIDYKKVDCIFDDPFKYTADADLIIFPDMEYYVPFYMKRGTGTEQPVCAVYYVDDLNSVSEQNLIDSPEEVSKLFSFKKTVEIAAIKTTRDRHCYCGLGAL